MICLYLKIPENISLLIFQEGFWVVSISFDRMVKFQFLAQSPVDHLATQPYLVLYSLCANLPLSLIVWLIVSSLSPHGPHLQFCCVLSIFIFTYLVLMALFCAAIRRDSVSLKRFPFISHVQVFSCEISIVHIIVFLSIFVYNYFYSVDAFVVCILSGGCNQSSTAFFFMYSSSHCIDASTLSWMLVSPLPPSFLDTEILSTSSLDFISLKVFPWIVRDSKAPQFSRTLLSILADLNAIVWMFSTSSLISKFSSSFIQSFRVWSKCINVS